MCWLILSLVKHSFQGKSVLSCIQFFLVSSMLMAHLNSVGGLSLFVPGSLMNTLNKICFSPGTQESLSDLTAYSFSFLNAGIAVVVLIVFCPI